MSPAVQVDYVAPVQYDSWRCHIACRTRISIIPQARIVRCCNRHFLSSFFLAGVPSGLTRVPNFVKRMIVFFRRRKGDICFCPDETQKKRAILCPPEDIGGVASNLLLPPEDIGGVDSDLLLPPAVTALVHPRSRIRATTTGKSR